MKENMKPDLTNPIGVMIWLLNDKDLVNTETGRLLMPDINAEGKVYGIMTDTVDFRKVNCTLEAEPSWFQENIIDLGEWSRVNTPAPGSGSIMRMGFIQPESIRDLANEVAAQKGWRDARISQEDFTRLLERNEKAVQSTLADRKRELDKVASAPSYPDPAHNDPIR